MQRMRGLLRILVVGFTVVSLMLVAAVAVAASSDKAGASNAVMNSVGALFSAPLVSSHSDQATAHSASTTDSGSVQNGTTTAASKSNGEGDGNNGVGTGCKPPKKHHNHATGGHKHHPCDDGRDDGSD
jgi:hypothetical protein